MIEWRKPTMTMVESASPRGYTVVVTPSNLPGRCNVMATYTGPEGPPSLHYEPGIESDAQSTARSQVELRKQATSRAKAACEAHAQALVRRKAEASTS